jgi:hypothetical protein
VPYYLHYFLQILLDMQSGFRPYLGLKLLLNNLLCRYFSCAKDLATCFSVNFCIAANAQSHAAENLNQPAKAIVIDIETKIFLSNEQECCFRNFNCFLDMWRIIFMKIYDICDTKKNLLGVVVHTNPLKIVRFPY